MIKRYLLAAVLHILVLTTASSGGPVYFWVTLYDGGKPVQVWVTRSEPKVREDTCRFVPQGQKNETVIHGVFSVSTQAPPEMPEREVSRHGF